MSGRLITALMCAALATGCQPGLTVTPVPSPTLAETVAPTARAQSTPSATFVVTKYLQMRPEAVHVWTSGPGQYPSFDRTTNDTGRSTALLQMAAQLHVAPFRFCPIDFGYAYTVEWWQDGQIIAEASLQAQGCRELRLDGGPSLDATAEFWNALADVLGVPESSLHPNVP